MMHAPPICVAHTTSVIWSSEKEKAIERAVRNTREVRETLFALPARLCRLLLTRFNL